MGGRIGIGGRIAAMVALLLLASASHAERAWVKDELRLNVRTGPGLQYRIIGGVKTGDSVKILQRGDGWTQIGAAGMESGWIPMGYLQPEPPAYLALEQHEQESQSMAARLEELTASEASLREQNTEISGRDGSQRAEIERLTRENLELRAGARWPEWITGAGIVLAGMGLGAILARSAGGRRTPRIKI